MLSLTPCSAAPDNAVLRIHYQNYTNPNFCTGGSAVAGGPAGRGGRSAAEDRDHVEDAETEAVAAGDVDDRNH